MDKLTVNSDKQPESTLSTEHIFKGKVISLQVDTVHISEGKVGQEKLSAILEFKLSWPCLMGSCSL